MVTMRKKKLSAHQKFVNKLRLPLQQYQSNHLFNSDDDDDKEILREELEKKFDELFGNTDDEE